MTTPPTVRTTRPTNGKPQPAKARPFPAPWAGLVRRLLGLRPGRYVVILHIEDGGPATWQIGAMGPDERRQ